MGTPSRDINSLSFSTFGLDSQALLDTVVEMIHNLNIHTELLISKKHVRDLVAQIQQNYNYNPFHSFSHAVTVTQMMYLFITKTKLINRINIKEKFSLLFCMICHDLDHPGLSNGYQINSKSPLATRYNNKSVLENHHLARTLEVISEYEENETSILVSFTENEREEFYKLITTLILSTDLASHFNLVKDYERAAEDFDWENSSHREQLFVMLVKAADISNEARPFDLAKSWAEALMNEYFAQSALEKTKALPVTPFMDKEKVVLPQTQLNFIDTFLLPTFQLLHKLLPEMQIFIDMIYKNKQKWGECCSQAGSTI